jgi:ribonucleoside-triphosphate reductase (formate)
VTAPETTPGQQYRWLVLLERHWIGAARGNQVSYTLKVFTDRHDLEAFRALVLRHQPEIRCCAILPSRPDHALGYEYLPEEEMPAGRFAHLVEGIEDPALHEAVDMAHLACASGVCPI